MGWDLPLDRRYLAVAPISPRRNAHRSDPQRWLGHPVARFTLLTGLLQLSVTESLCHFLSQR